jgi:hypothetical protein
MANAGSVPETASATAHHPGAGSATETGHTENSTEMISWVATAVTEPTHVIATKWM